MSIRPTLSDDEAETLLACLDFCIDRLDVRLGKYQEAVEAFALSMARHKILKLRAKLFPPKGQK